MNPIKTKIKDHVIIEPIISAGFAYTHLPNSGIFVQINYTDVSF